MNITKTDNSATYRTLEHECKQSFLAAGIELSPDATIKLYHAYLQINMHDMYSTYAWLTLYPKKDNYVIQENSMSVSANHVFSPNQSNSVWTIKHAYNIIENWKKACEIVNEYCMKYNEMVKDLASQYEQ